jgi:hypothetical protein
MRTLTLVLRESCLCGCGNTPKTPGARFCHGHSSKLPEYKAMISEVHKGKTLSPQTRRKLSAAKKGKQYTPGWKIKESWKRRKAAA